MRKRFEQQNTLDAKPIPEVKIDSRSRHELPALLAGLQYIFITRELNEAIFEIVEGSIMGDRKKLGRLGMSLWEILVLGTVRLNLDVDYDSLHDLSNHHEVLRGIMGVATNNIFKEGKYYALQTLKDNVGLLDEATLKQINEVVVKAGHKLKKKEEGLCGEAAIKLNLKADSYAVERNIHFPTDINLLWDSARKCLDVVGQVNDHYGKLSGWRKDSWWWKILKKLYVLTANTHQGKGKDYQQRLQEEVKRYLQKARKLEFKVQEVVVFLVKKVQTDFEVAAILKELTFYHKMLVKHIDLLERRVIKGQTIPHEEKVFSIFEPQTEWISKGKHHQKVELGHNTLITTDQYHFIVDHEVMVGQTDKAQVIPLARRLSDCFGTGYILDSISFDRGFYSNLAKLAVGSFFNKVIMPKNTKKTAVQEIEESERTFVAFRKQHAAVESNINELEHAGVNKVPDKGMHGFRRYVALGILAYNLKRLGKLVIEQEILPTTVNLGRERKAAAA
jgi:transposase, IS5 family